jgi:predicted ester cyclase
MMVAIFASGDLSDVGSVVAEGYIDHQGLAGEECSGTDGFRRVVTAARGAMLDLEVDIRDILSDGEKAAARLHWHAMTSAGVIIDRETIDIIHVKDGKAIEHWGLRLWALPPSPLA